MKKLKNILIRYTLIYFCVLITYLFVDLFFIQWLHLHDDLILKWGMTATFSLIIVLIFDHFFVNRKLPSEPCCTFTSLLVKPFAYWYRSAIHEAGHIIVAEHFGINTTEVELDYEKSYIKLDMPDILSKEENHKMILILYSGFLSEELILGSASTGVMNGSDSDFARANNLTKQYLTLNRDISFSTHEKNIAKKIVECSTKFEQEAKDILLQHKQEIPQKARDILLKSNLTVTNNGLYYIKK